MTRGQQEGPHCWCSSAVTERQSKFVSGSGDGFTEPESERGLLTGVSNLIVHKKRTLCQCMGRADGHNEGLNWIWRFLALVQVEALKEPEWHWEVHNGLITKLIQLKSIISLCKHRLQLLKFQWNSKWHNNFWQSTLECNKKKTCKTLDITGNLLDRYDFSCMDAFHALCTKNAQIIYGTQNTDYTIIKIQKIIHELRYLSTYIG
jgi:hypothetical protein